MAFGTTGDGRLLLASGSWDRSVRVWDPLTGAPVGQPLTGHTDFVASVAFGTTGDGRLLLASGSRDRSVRVWDPLTGARVGKPLTGHTGTVASVAFGTTRDGLLLASGSQDGSVRVWDPLTGTLVGKRIGRFSRCRRWRSAPWPTGGYSWPPAAGTGRCGCRIRSPAPA